MRTTYTLLTAAAAASGSLLQLVLVSLVIAVVALVSSVPLFLHLLIHSQLLPNCFKRLNTFTKPIQQESKNGRRKA